MPKKNFYKNYFEIFKSKISFSEEILQKIEKIEKIIMNVKKIIKKYSYLVMEEALLLLAISQLTAIICLKYDVLILMRQVF